MRCAQPSALVPTGIPGPGHGRKPSGSGNHVVRAGRWDGVRRNTITVAGGRCVGLVKGGVPMSTIIERSGPRAFRLCGNVDASNAASVADVLEPHLSEPGDITLDLRELE